MPRYSTVQRHPDNPSNAIIHLNSSETFNVPCGGKELSAHDPHYVATDYHDSLMTEMLQSHAFHDMCLIGPKVRETIAH